ncbi:hypothetical protein B0H67DRAFT_666963 [Lasiosphaeris hirsuta]|uniref:Uncharacterized protein n=1 Tax=Lasiosphaeris hirsuta TaxID=260670 RepID=A0AA40AI34_9PEZI|nr:hypothetical protein B0H67DRAFT_666963 [Lasiosphaeris hirsuta]
MKFISLITSALAATALAKPIEERFALNSTESGLTTLFKRDNVEFWVYPAKNACTDGGTFFTLTGAGVKNNFGSTPQIDVLIIKLSPNFHLTLYTGRDQSGLKTQLGQDSVGICRTHRVGEAGWLSFGLFNGA